ncbi:hypothetical protein VNO78_16253 [Psophocarpus tetragonolobus]|uniref:ADP-ribosyl cyclase/cyclic ADP-ribose hydrolase n=1 Tax=Psophocarpus tetragonolobus TaxID=3891 RepID=A0AAN9SFG8_PSOTE
MSTSSSSDAMSGRQIKHDVFLSFRGEDIRYNFISHLYAQLQNKNIETFIDYTLERGEEISLALHTAIEESMIYIIVFSPEYASSTWCLDELTKILECQKRYGRYVIPIFYKVDPSHVKKWRERYAEAFLMHEERFKDNIAKVDQWKIALTKAAQLSGWVSQLNRPESTLIENIVEDVLRKLNRSSITIDQGIIGIENHIAQIQSLLQLESPAIRIIGIWGMGGIGKTTISSQIYKKLTVLFDSSSLVLNGQIEIKRHGIKYVRREYLSELLGENISHHPLMYFRERLRRKKVLLIVDDMNNLSHLNDLIGEPDDFGQGSRIIVTSRDLQVLRNGRVDEIYEVKEMNFQDSLKLFSLNAFKKQHPVETYMDLSVKVLNYAQGIPLALKILGSLLYGRTRETWESELQKLEKLPDIEIFNILKVSYDGLDPQQKDIFLDIACFYTDQEENVVARTLCSYGFYANIAMDVLKDKCLISVLEGRIVMHDLIKEMGHEIVRQECVNNPGKRSRLWKVEEIYHVLRKNKGTDAIQCIVLDTLKIKRVKLHSQTFKNMDNLRMLQFCNTCKYGCGRESNVLLESSLESLPDGLMILHWDVFPERFLPHNFYPENLVRLEMRNCHLEHLWQANQYLPPKLKRLDLSYSRKLTRIPDLYQSPDIEEIILSDCEKLIEVYSSGFLSKLNCLCLNGCVELRSLTIASNILSRSSGLIFLQNCHMLKTFSISNRTEVVPRGIRHTITNFFFSQLAQMFLDACISLQHCNFYTSPFTFYPVVNIDDRHQERETNDIGLDLNYLKMLIEGGVSKFSSPNELCCLDLSRCKSLTSLPLEFDLSKLKFLKKLVFSGCSNLEKFPEIENTMENLEVLILESTSLQTLPSSLCRLVGLEELSLCSCESLEIIPSSIGNLSKLSNLGLTNCKSLKSLPCSIFKLKLRKLGLCGCTMLETLPAIIEPAETFAHLDLSKTAIKELPSSLANLVRLQTLSLNMCTNLDSLPNSIVNLKLLSKLDCSGCVRLTEIPSDIGRLSLLREVSLSESAIVNLPESIVHLSSLKLLDLSDCINLEYIPQLPPFLEQLLAFDCPSIRRVVSNSLIQIPPNFKEGVFKFYFTNGQQMDPGTRANILDDAKLRMTEDAYKSVFFCFPGSAVPYWFPFSAKGHSVTINTDSLNFCSDDRLIGFALCVVLGMLDMNDIESRYGSFSYSLKFNSEDGAYILPNNHDLRNNFKWKGRERIVDQDHTFLWKYNLESPRMSGMSLTLCHARSFTFEISPYDYGFSRRNFKSIVREFKSTVIVKECGICPLYPKENYDNDAVAGDDHSSFMRFSKNDMEEPISCSSSNLACCVFHNYDCLNGFQILGSLTSLASKQDMAKYYSLHCSGRGS